MAGKNNGILIFDFDGTIADTKSLYYHAISKELKIFGYSYKDIDKAIDFGFGLRETLKKLGLSFLTRWFMHKKIMKRVRSHANNIKKCKDVSMIKEIKTEKILITNSLKEFAIPVLKHLKLLKEFKEIYGADDFIDKAEFIKNYLKENKIKKEKCFYIGDRVADVRTARKVGCKSIIILGKCAWDNRKEILKAKPDFIIESIADLKKIIK